MIDIRKRISLLLIGCLLLLIPPASAWGDADLGPRITSAQVGEKGLLGATEVKVIKDDLTRDGKISIWGEAEGGNTSVSKVEVSLDGGETWKEATGGERWQYEFRPLPKYTYFVTVRVTNADGAVSEHRRFGITRLTYLPITLAELIQGQANELAQAYMSKDLARYMALISKGYQNIPRGWHRLRKAIENDFRSLNNITLRFTVNQVYALKGVIMADIHWRLTYAGLTEPKEGYVEIHFDPQDQLKITLQRKDLYFGSAPIGHDARVEIDIRSMPLFTFIVTDLDKAGAGSVTVRVRHTSISGGVHFNGTLTLTETPRLSGVFSGSRNFLVTSGDRIIATYIDEITSDWRRNVRRTDTYITP